MLLFDLPLGISGNYKLYGFLMFLGGAKTEDYEWENSLRVRAEQLLVIWKI